MGGDMVLIANFEDIQKGTKLMPEYRKQNRGNHSVLIKVFMPSNMT